MAPSSDYGSDLDTDGEEAVDAFLSALDVNPIAPHGFALESIVEDEGSRSQPIARIPRSSPGDVGEAFARLRGSQGLGQGSEARAGAHVEPESAVGNQDNVDTPRMADRDEVGEGLRDTSNLSVESVATAQDDTRSPIERFRTAPKKPLSVTDIVSPAWCELQYEYTLTKFGKKKQTPAMRQGSAVHRALEEEVHTMVPVTVKTLEDFWGLRIWNVIQGLRTLRLTGLTRELEIWGVVHGQVVNGVIDEISYTCPSPQLEAELDAKRASKSGKIDVLPTQQTLDEFFGSQKSNNGTSLPQPPIRKMYLTDVKTRSRASLPSQAAMRPTIMQLMLYRALFASLAANEVPAHVIFARYSLDSGARFSDDFIAAVSSLDLHELVDGQRSALQELQQHHCLTLLWQLMVQEFALTVPSPSSIGDVLCARYVHAEMQTEIGIKCFAFVAEQLERFLTDEMRWWKGERPARGVEIEEAYKCQNCDFADDCTWRKDKVAEAVKRSRARHRRTKGTVREGG